MSVVDYSRFDAIAVEDEPAYTSDPAGRSFSHAAEAHSLVNWRELEETSHRPGGPGALRDERA